MDKTYDTKEVSNLSLYSQTHISMLGKKMNIQKVKGKYAFTEQDLKEVLTLKKGKYSFALGYKRLDKYDRPKVIEASLKRSREKRKLEKSNKLLEEIC